MPKEDMIRKIDLRPRPNMEPSSPTIRIIAGNSGGGGSNPGRTIIIVESRLYVGRLEGPHVGMFRLGDTIFLQAVDTANTPFFSVGGVDFATNRTWLKLGYEGYPGIRLKDPTTGSGFPEEQRGLEVDAECLVGKIPVTVDLAYNYLTDANGNLLADDAGNPLYSEAT